MKYTVIASYKSYCATEVEAENKDEALQKAHEMDGGDFEPIDLPHDDGEWTIEKIKLSPDNFTAEQQAFIKAYESNVADAPTEIVQAFILSTDDDEFCKAFGNEYYTGLADARGVWDDAKRYYKEAK